MIEYIIKVVQGIQHYYGDQSKRINSLKVIYPDQQKTQQDINYWLELFPNKIIQVKNKGKLFGELDRWTMKRDDLSKIFREDYEESLLSFYSDKNLEKEFPNLFTLFRALLLLIPSSAYNERVNSLLGNIRTDKRQSLEFNSVRAIIMIKANIDIINYKDKNQLQEINEMYNSKKNLPAEMPAAKRRPKILKDIPGVGPAIEKRLITHD